MEPNAVPSHGMEATAPFSISNPERLAVKTICASDILKKVVQSAQRLNKVDIVLNRYLHQARLLLVWKRGSGAMKMAGSAAKTVGTLMLVAAPLHPRIAMGVRVAHKLWKLGTSLKILNAIANMIRDVWQKGCRSVLLEFTHCAAALTRNLGVFGELLRDLQGATPPIHTTGQNGPLVIMDAIKSFIPPHQIPYATHVINMAFGNELYSPLFAFTALALDYHNSSNIAQVMLEIESFHFDDFIENSESRTLVAIGSFLHVSRELFDFLDGFQNLTERDCQFLQECLKRLSEESSSIMKAVVVLVSLDKIRKQLNADANVNNAPGQATSENLPSLYSSRDISQAENSSRERALESPCSTENGAVHELEHAAHPEHENLVCGSSLSFVERNENSEQQSECPGVETVNIERSLNIANDETESTVEECIASSHNTPTENNDKIPSITEQQPSVQPPKRSLVSNLLSPISTVVGRGGNMLVGTGSSFFSSAIYCRNKLTGQSSTSSEDTSDQFSNTHGEFRDLTRL